MNDHIYFLIMNVERERVIRHLKTNKGKLLKTSVSANSLGYTYCFNTV